MAILGKYKINAEVRTETSARDLRRDGQLPAVVYGGDLEQPVKLVFSGLEFSKLFNEAGTSSIITITAPEQEFQVLVKDIQRDPMTNALSHVDLQQIRMNQAIRTDVPLHIEGEAPAVEEFDGVLVQTKDHIEIEALPKDLPHNITVDISGLVNLDDQITIADLSIPEGVEVFDDPEELVIAVRPPREEEPEPEAVSEEEALANIESTEEKPADEVAES